MSLRTVRHWDAGRNRVPWSVVRLLRLMRAGELGGLLDGWEGWTVWRDRLVSPDGRVYTERDMRRWWLTIEHARFFREAYDRDTLGGVGATAPADACEAVPLIWEPGRGADRSPPPSTPLPGPIPAKPAFLLSGAWSWPGVLPVKCAALCREDAGAGDVYVRAFQGTERGGSEGIQLGEVRSTSPG